MADVADRITDYLCAGGLFNPELMEHRKVSDLLRDCRDEIERLRGLGECICPQCGIRHGGHFAPGDF